MARRAPMQWQLPIWGVRIRVLVVVARQPSGPEEILKKVSATLYEEAIRIHPRGTCYGPLHQAWTEEILSYWPSEVRSRTQLGARLSAASDPCIFKL
jgi:hypothetical protein